METSSLEKIWKTYSRILRVRLEKQSQQIKYLEVGTYYIAGYQHLLFLMDKYGFMEITPDNWEQLTIWDTEEINIISDIQKQWEKDMFDARVEARKWLEEEQEFYIEARSRFLKDKIAQGEDYLKRFYQQAERNNRKYMRRIITSVEKEVLLCFWAKDEVEEYMVKLRRQLYRIEHRNEVKEGEITDGMIESARQYPFEKLAEINRAGFTKCPYHNERTPSFYVKNNFGYCFGCSTSCDTIKYVMDTMNKNFVEAVKYLNNTI